MSRNLILKRRWLCAGVVREIEAVESALRKFGSPIYVLKEIIHNRAAIASLEPRGAMFVPSLQAVPSGARLFFSAHGISPQKWSEARARGLTKRAPIQRLRNWLRRSMRPPATTAAASWCPTEAATSA